MPFSFSNQLSAIIGYAEQQKPLSILDIGVGMGQYGFLLRTNLENINLFEINGANARLRDKNQWRIKIDGIEGYAGYLTPVHNYAYNRILIGDALELLPTLASNSYDLVLAIDILEHFYKEQGVHFLKECRRIAKGSSLISTPKEFMEQDVPANPFENHRSVWNDEDLKRCGFDTFLPNPFSWIALASHHE
ncbi:MAG TPA: class I SAM-dependent methyltransferase [Nitrosomonas sp.]|nr:class I SAM-dependent methyltransferase [Nitrosomonas sp.]HMW19954.1 class I SAM-dependent methyltransferase [Nitrosomonas sp.]HMW68553.1 class I SAM-dependent methyltransferase [Nitrosomonas sp.]HMY60781.1 class I SAM-dependent methyltransferase [Nitrosomonas sp.]HMY89282.1 class I SAM-dependent methyltransferase [Nitrosomonas sp.]